MARKNPSGRESASVQERRRPPQPRRRAALHVIHAFPFQREHLYVFAICSGLILTGFLTLGMGSITLAPFLMVLGYGVGIPLAILWKGGAKEKGNASDPEPLPSQASQDTGG